MLYDELTSGPLSTQIAPYIQSGDDGAIYHLLHVKNIPKVSLIEWQTFAQYLATSGLRADIENWKTNLDKEVRAIAFTLIDGLNRGTGSLDFSNLNNVGMLDYLISKSLITSQNKFDILMLSTIQISRADQLDFPCNISDIAHALRGG